jgi:hypothetical protein
MKILVVTNMYAGSNPTHPSQGIFVTEQVEAFRRLYGETVDVFVIEGYRGRSAYLRSLCRVVSLVRRNAYDVVHYHFGLSACSAPLVRLFSPSKIVITFHGSDVMGKRGMRALSLFFARFAHACVGVSDEIRARLQSVAKCCLTIPCAVNETLFIAPIDEERREGRQKVVVFPSSPQRTEKGYPLFKATVIQLCQGGEFDILEQHIDGLDRWEVRGLLARADCLLMTSEREGSPQSVKEAMACNLPVVSVDVGDVRNLLTCVSQSVVVDDRNAETLARSVADVLRDGKRSNGRLRLQMLGYFSDDITVRIADIYANLLDKNGCNQFSSSCDGSH